MREVSGSTWTFQIIILFILIFACFLTLVLSYSKAYIIKNDILDIIEKYEGVTNESSNIIGNYLYSKGYSTLGKCPERKNENEELWYGVMDYNGTYESSQDNTEYYYCFQQIPVYTNAKVEPIAYYYNIKIFYKFNLPVIGEITTMKINGRTSSFIGNGAL